MHVYFEMNLLFEYLFNKVFLCLNYVTSMNNHLKGISYNTTYFDIAAITFSFFLKLKSVREIS